VYFLSKVHARKRKGEEDEPEGREEEVERRKWKRKN